MNTDELFLEIYSLSKLCLAPIETIVTLFTVRYCDSGVAINLVLTDKRADEKAVLIDLSSFNYSLLKPSEIPRYASTSELPNVVVKERTCVAGLCACLRQLVKSRIAYSPLHHSKELLGFKSACLLSCSESSVWTKFCEVDLISSIKYLDELSPVIPANLARFECHMSKPLRLHNLYKYAAMSKKSAGNRKADKNNEREVPEHVFAEGSYITLADVIIFVCVHVFVTAYNPESDDLPPLIPLTMKWYEKMMSNEAIAESLDCLKYLERTTERSTSLVLPTVENQSLYKSDPKRYKPRNRIYTRQTDINDSLNLISELNVTTDLDPEPFGSGVVFSWDNIPFDATPEGGALPKSRLKRKFEQLENLCKPVLGLAKPGDTIVDFCSGSGHLGILIAYLLPDCEVILLENKEESLNRAKERVEKLGLNNVRFYQCNLDYFKGNFDIGVSLHACGVATDLVIQHCVNMGAVFVCCPCCYGGVHDCHRITYPRSDIFKNKIDTRSYLVLGHSADQTHDKNNSKTDQGYKCMSIIDTDRKLHAEQFDYVVHLGKLVPDNCTPKNHLLVGIPRVKS